MFLSSFGDLYFVPVIGSHVNFITIYTVIIQVLSLNLSAHFEGLVCCRKDAVRSYPRAAGHGHVQNENADTLVQK